MADRVVKVKLVADISDYTAGLVKAAAATRALGGDVEKSIDRNVGPAMSRAGERQGGVLARGINYGLIRNSPLIAAGVGAALTVGAPVMIAAAGTLFAGIGAVAAAQTVEVRQAWTEMGHAVRDGAVQDAAVLVPVYTAMAEQIGRAFQEMRPMLREAFADSAPLIESFADGVIALAQNAMPGLVRAVASAEPVFEGLEHFLAATGSGLTDFFDAISGHSPAAGSAFASLGDIIGDLLPILGELLGQGAEIAADVLPAVAYATGTVLDVMQALGPMLPSVVAGFVAFKAAQAAAGFMQTFAVQAQYATIAMTGSVNAGTKVGGVLSGLGRALPAVGIAVGIVGAAMAQGEAQLDGWARGLLEGGAAAQTVRDDIAGLADTWGGWQGVVASFAPGMGGVAGALGDAGNAMEAAEERAKALFDAMSPLEQAQQRVTQATNFLSSTLDDFGAGSNEAEGAARALESAQGELERQNADLEMAIDGVTSAMIDQASQALAAANSDFAYRDSVNKLNDQMVVLSDTLADPKASADDLAASMMEVEEDILKVVDAAGRLASDSLPSTATELQHSQAAAAGSLAELIRLRDEMGSNFPAALNQTISRLQQSGVALTNTGLAGSETASRIRDLGFAVREVPGQKFVKIDAPTGPQIAQLEALGYKVTHLPNGDIYVSADTATANAAIDYAARNRTANIFVRTVGSNQSVAGSSIRSLQAEGGIVKAFAGGGFNPMRGGIAQVVPPNTWRVIGDRARDDEAYIPINSDARSHEILRQTAERMGYGMGREVSGSSGSTVNVAAPSMAGVALSARIFIGTREITDIVRVEVDDSMGSLAGGLSSKGVRVP